jgi:lysophospholipase L1-like esterase
MNRRKIAILLLCLALLFAFPESGQAAPPGKTAGAWVTSWTSVPQQPIPGTAEQFDNQTIRLIVRTTVAGNQLRIRLSNEYGSEPLEIGSVHAARLVIGSSVDSETDRQVTFSHSDSIVIAPGSSIQSDPFDLSVKRSELVAISIFLPHRSVATTTHILALSNGYIGRGDQSSADIFSSERTIDSRPFLTSLDVWTSKPATAIALFGDSTVDGVGASPDLDERWSDQIARELGRRQFRRNIGVVNLGIIGNRLLKASPVGEGSPFGNALGDAGVHRFARDISSIHGASHVIVRIGINDIGFPGSFEKDSVPVTGEMLIGGYRSLIKAAHKRKVKIIIATLAPFKGTKLADGFYTEAKEEMRMMVNKWMRESADVDGLLDLDRVLRDQADPSKLNPEFDSGDHLHINAKGNRAAAIAAVAILF